MTRDTAFNLLNCGVASAISVSSRGYAPVTLHHHPYQYRLQYSVYTGVKSFSLSENWYICIGGL